VNSVSSSRDVIGAEFGRCRAHSSLSANFPFARSSCMLNAAHALPYCATRLVTRGWTRATHSLRPVREFGAHNISSRYTRLGASMRYKAGFLNSPAKATYIAADQALAKDPAPMSAEAIQELVKPLTEDFGIPLPPEEPGSEGSPFIFLVIAQLMKMHV